MDLSDVSFLQNGTGKDMVFLHGYLSSKEAFAAQIDYFSAFFRVTALDFLGQGQSGELKTPFSVSDYADWTEAVLEKLGVKNAYVVAHSFGSRVAVKMAARGGQVCDKLLLVGPAGVILKRGFSYKFKVKAYRICKKMFPAFAERKFGSAEYKTLSPVMKESYKKIVNEDLRADAAKIKLPVLLVRGKDDKTTTAAETAAYQSVLQKGRTEMMSGGHFAFAQHPLAFNLIAEEFFSHG